MNEKILNLQKECEEKLNVFLLWKGSAHMFYDNKENKFKLKVKMNSYLSNEEFNFINNVFDEFIFNVKFIKLKLKLAKPFVKFIDWLAELFSKNSKENVIFELYSQNKMSSRNVKDYLKINQDEFEKKLIRRGLPLICDDENIDFIPVKR
jgi:hypothetical protein